LVTAESQQNLDRVPVRSREIAAGAIELALDVQRVMVAAGKSVIVILGSQWHCSNEDHTCRQKECFHFHGYG